MVFDISRIEDAFRYFQTKDHIGKFGVSLENGEGLIKVLPSKHNARLLAEKSYLLAGCFGGLGGAIAKWTVSRGAVKLVF